MNRIARVQVLLLAIGIALVLTASISTLTPTLTAFVYVDVAGIEHVPAGVYTPALTIEALRASISHTVQLNNLEGLVGFPSFHTAEALMFIWALWPFRWLR